MRILAAALLALGLLALVFRGFSYRKEERDAKIGPVEISVTERKHVDVPTWVGVILVVTGGGLLLADKRVPGR
jgi:hypothetical protein